MDGDDCIATKLLNQVTKLRHHGTSNANVKLVDCVMEHVSSVSISSPHDLSTLCLYVHASMHSYHSPHFCGESLTMADRGNKVRS